jgi:large subunit ribosomal protein L24
MAIKKNDTVIILTGKDKGKTGKVTKVLPKIDKVIVEGINQMKKNQRPRKQGQKGQIVTVTMPIHISNVMLEADRKPKKAAPAKKVVAEKKPAAKPVKSKNKEN